MPVVTVRRVTLRDVASRAGLSASAASLALSGHPSIPETTRERVRAAAAELGYVPNPTARALRTQRHGAIALVRLGIGPDSWGPFFSDLLTAVADEARRQEYNVMLINAAPRMAAEAPRLDQLLANARVDGAILLGMGRETDLRALHRQEFPFIFVGKRELPGMALPYVSTDYVGAARMVVDHLVRLGHRRIAIALDPAMREWPWVRDRIAGYRLAMQEHGLETGPELLLELGPGSAAKNHPTAVPATGTSHAAHLDGGAEATGGTETADRDNEAAAVASWLETGSAWDVASWQATGITAIFAVAPGYQLPMRVLRHLHLNGVAVPQQMAVVGFDDLPEADLLLPPLTTVRQPMAALGTLAARTLLAWINGAPREPQIATLPATLVVRESCGARMAARQRKTIWPPTSSAAGADAAPASATPV
jgi:DNA-binding LacI/PurR family transcriptional regulator